MTPALDNVRRPERFVVVQTTRRGRVIRHGGWRLAENAIDDARDLASAWCDEGDLVMVVDLDIVAGGDDGVVWRAVA